jgi:hypothetical protein
MTDRSAHRLARCPQWAVIFSARPMLDVIRVFTGIPLEKFPIYHPTALVVDDTPVLPPLLRR